MPGDIQKSSKPLRLAASIQNKNNKEQNHILWTPTGKNLSKFTYANPTWV